MVTVASVLSSVNLNGPAICELPARSVAVAEMT
jgi:hypothetical protein